MKWFIYSFLPLLMAVQSLRAQVVADTLSPLSGKKDTVMLRYERHMRHYKNFWRHLTPKQFTLQYAGSIGVVSAGLGWYYGRQDSWETDLLFGYLPKYSSDASKITMTVRQSYIPFRINLNEQFQLEPLACGLFFNTIFGDEFWAEQPDRYPKKYYGFSTKIRTHIFVGQRIKFRIPSEKRIYHKSVSLYYQFSTCDLYIASAFTNKYVSLKDVLSLAFGLRWEYF